MAEEGEGVSTPSEQLAARGVGEELSGEAGRGGDARSEPPHHGKTKKKRRGKRKGGGGGGEGGGAEHGGAGGEGGGGGGGEWEGGGSAVGEDSADAAATSTVTTAKNLQEILRKLTLEEKSKTHEFWDTQPVPKLEESVAEMGPLEPDKEHVRQEPLSLPDKFVWDELDLSNEDHLTELYILLSENYVEDEDNMFRFDYSRKFLRWALHPPGWKSSWHCGVRVATNRKLVGFISAVPALIRIRDHEQTMVEINFLCVHKKLRTKRVAPVLIKEITRRVHVEGIFQAVYTAGILLPKPVSVCRYWHRSLNPKKLVEVQFTSIHRHMTLQRMIRLYRLPDTPRTVGLREIERKDIPEVFQLINRYLRQFDMAPVFRKEEEIVWWFLSQKDVISCYVVENPKTNKLTDMFSFYHLPSTVVHHPVHKVLNVAYAFYSASFRTPLKDLMLDALILAKQGGADVFNALDVMDNKHFLEELKFGVGDGHLHYYFYNWRCPEIPPDKVGLVLQ